MPATAGETPSAMSPGARRKRWFEVLLVLLVALTGPLTRALYILNTGPRSFLPRSSSSWLLGLLNEVIGLLLLGYVLSRSGRRFKDLGLYWSLRDFGFGFLVYLGSLATYVTGSLCIQLVHYFKYSAFYMGPSGKDFFGHPGFGMIPFVLFNPFFEELIVRAYLMTEIRDLTGSVVLAGSVSVVLQSAYHLYYGWLGALSVAFLFIPFAVYYALTRRALPIIVAHGMFDIVAFIRLW